MQRGKICLMFVLDFVHRHLQLQLNAHALFLAVYPTEFDTKNNALVHLTKHQNKLQTI